MCCGCLPKSKWIGGADRQAKSIDEGRCPYVCLSNFLFTFLKVSPSPLSYVEVLVSKGNALIMFREKSSSF